MGLTVDSDARCVLDVSALLAYLHDETGAEQVAVTLERALISSVNWSEVLQKAITYNTDVAGLRQDLEALGLAIVSFDAEQAELAAQLWLSTKHAGLSLANRACLALALSRQLPALTADRAWPQVREHVQLIR